MIELVFIAAGEVLHQIGDITYTMRPGDLYTIEPGVSHGYIGSEHTDCVMYNIHFDRSFLNEEMHVLSGILIGPELLYCSPFLRATAPFSLYLNVPEPYVPRVMAHIEAMMDELAREEAGFTLVLKTRLIECMVLFSRLHRMQQLPQPEENGAEAWLFQVVSYLKQHYSQPLSLEQISRNCGMSVSSFTAKFKRITGQTLLEYKHDLQIKAACRLLSERELKIAAVAQEVGFKDTSFFYKLFRKKVGVTPSAYIKRKRPKGAAGSKRQWV